MRTLVLVFGTLLLLAFNAFTVGIIPGSILFKFGDGLSLLLIGEDILGTLEGDSYWPISLGYGFVWPFSLSLFSFISIRLYERKIRFFRTKISRSIMFVLNLTIFTMVLAMIFRLLNAI